MNNNSNDEAIQEILRSIVYLLQETMKQTTKVYEGIVLSQSNGKVNVKYNGEIHSIKVYGSALPAVNQIVPVIIPQGNQTLAWTFSPPSNSATTP